ncbi:H-NS family nucleoid-associated regulatory protein [Cupriavidus necator]|uniref:H-NS family nucleoid-associated regulatory protein n=1 Tax=Cupriavidus necator TaxID=106590 RepID=UPI000ADFF636
MAEVATQPFHAFPYGSEMQQLRQRADAILWVKSQMARNGISIDDLVAAGCFSERPSRSDANTAACVRYRDAAGHVWDGNGKLPDWLQRAVNAGQSVEHFKVE